MTSQIANRWLLVLLMAILVGTSAAQDSKPEENASQETASSSPKPESVAPTSATPESKSTEKASQETLAKNPQQEPPAHKSAEQAASAFKSRREMLSYAFGVELGRSLKAQGVNPDVDLMVKALRDTLAGNKLLISETDATAALKAYEEDQKRDFEHAKQMISAKNKKAGEALFAENLKNDGIVTLASGLQYKVLKQGDGKIPTLGDKVVCNYRGTLLDGKEFDSSYKRNQPATVPVKGLIRGWSEALQLMPVGSKWQLFIPPPLGYGERVVGGIGPNSMLLFEVELISIQDKAQNVQDKPEGVVAKPQGSL
jgi:FKBP-type peptidyl-prolyl cis-trans isomerase FklB